MRHRTELPHVLDVDVTTRGRLPSAADYARSKIGELGAAHPPTGAARPRQTDQTSRSGGRATLIAQGNLDVTSARPSRSRASRRAMPSIGSRRDCGAGSNELPSIGKRGAASWPAAIPHEWRHQSEPTHRPGYYPRPVDDRRIIRHKSFTLAACTVDEAALEMDLLDYEFHLFTEIGTAHRQCALPSRPDGLPSGTLCPAPEIREIYLLREFRISSAVFFHTNGLGSAFHDWIHFRMSFSRAWTFLYTPRWSRSVR